MDTHIKVLGVLYVVLGALGVLGAFALLLLAGGIAGLVGATADSGDAAIALPIIGMVGTAVALFLLVVSLPGVIIGVGLLKLRPWSRLAGIILSVISLINFPFGTVIGAYGLWVLLTPESEPFFRPI